MASPFKTLLIVAGIALGVASLSPAAAEAGGRATVLYDDGAVTIKVSDSRRAERHHKKRRAHKKRHVEKKRHTKRKTRRAEHYHPRPIYRPHRPHYGYGAHRPRRYARCTPRRALRKAERRGLRRAHIRRVGPRGVVVAARRRGQRVVIGFGRHRSCPVRFVRAR